MTLPSTESLAAMVTGITETMFGLSFAMQAGSPAPSTPDASWQTVIIGIKGRPDVTVAIAAGSRDAEALAATMFGVAAGEVDQEMCNDSLSELANIVAGQVKIVVGDSYTLGLPRVLPAAAVGALATWRSASLVSKAADLSLWVALGEST